MLVLLSCLLCISHAGLITSDSGLYCADDALTMNWFDAEIYCNDNFAGFASYHSEEEWQELRALSLRIGSGFNWNGAYEEEGSFDILFSDGTPYDYEVATENDAVSDAEYGLCSSRDALYLGINPYYTTGFMCNCAPGEEPPKDRELCPNSCESVSWDGCDLCRCRKEENIICESNGCEASMDRYCLYTERVNIACPEDCARYDMGGRQCMCKQKGEGFMLCEPEAKISPNIRPHCIERSKEFDARFQQKNSKQFNANDVNGSIRSQTFLSRHWMLFCVAAIAMCGCLSVFLYHSTVCAKKGQYQSLL